MKWLLPYISIVWSLIQPQVALAEDAKASPSVSVVSTRNPVEKSYRKMIEGMQLFEENHQLAPQASLRFRLLPRQPDVNMQGITLKVVGDTVTLPIELAPDNSFAIERNDKALAEDASVIPNRKANSMTWRAMVRTPGLGEHVRRMGDLRMECIVGIKAGLVSNYTSLTYIEQQRKMARRGARSCDDDSFHYLMFAERPLFKVTIRDGNRRAVLEFNQMYAGGRNFTPELLAQCDCQSLQEKAFHAPIHDTKWSDDALIEFEYMDDAPAAQDEVQGTPIVPGKSSQDDVIKALGKQHEIKFTNGYTIWVYAFDMPPPPPPPKRPSQLPPPIEPNKRVELVVLFNPAGIVSKMRTHEPKLVSIDTP